MAYENGGRLIDASDYSSEDEGTYGYKIERS